MLYAQRVTAHDTRTGALRAVDSIRLLVVHTSEGGELPTSAEALARFISSPRSATNLASYHYIADHDQVIPSVPDDHVAYANAGANHDSISICYPGKAGQTPEQWADESSTAQHEQVACWLADKSKQYGIPLRKLTVAEVKAGERGVCGHNEVSLAFRRSTHTDPGKAYPWESVMARAVVIATPPPVILPLNGVLVDSYLDHNGIIFGYSKSLNVKQHVPTFEAWNLQKGLRGLAGEEPLPIHLADRVFMHATGPVIGPLPVNAEGRPITDGFGAAV